MRVMQDNIIDADLSGLTEQERLEYFFNVCKILGLDPKTLPLEYLRLDGELHLTIKQEE